MLFVRTTDHEMAINRVDEGAAVWVDRTFELSRRHNAVEYSVGNLVNMTWWLAGHVCLLLFRSLGYGLALGVSS